MATARRGLRSNCNRRMPELPQEERTQSPQRYKSSPFQKSSDGSLLQTTRSIDDQSSCSDEEGMGADEADCCLPSSSRCSPLLGSRKLKSPMKVSDYDEGECNLNLSNRSNKTECSHGSSPQLKENSSIQKRSKFRSPNNKTTLNDRQSKEDSYMENPEPVVAKGQVGIMPVVYIGFVMLLMGGLGISAYLFNKTDNFNRKMKPKNITEIYHDLKVDLQTVHKQLELTRKTWLQVRSQLDSIMIPSPLQPATILVIVPKGAERTAICFTHMLSESIKHAFGDSRTSVYDTKANAKMSSSDVKLELDELLSGLQENHVAVVHNLERLAAPAALILHGYCDNDNAPHKQAMILLTLEVSLNYDSLSSMDPYTIIEETLSAAWIGPENPEPIRMQDFSAVISRIAVSPVIIRPESKYKLDELCST